eukprot:4847021-Pleurochrysis_carterae.AAC.1
MGRADGRSGPDVSHRSMRVKHRVHPARGRPRGPRKRGLVAAHSHRGPRSPSGVGAERLRLPHPRPLEPPERDVGPDREAGVPQPMYRFWLYDHFQDRNCFQTCDMLIDLYPVFISVITCQQCWRLRL